MKVRKIPKRMCIACKNSICKKDLLRVVKTPDGKILLDLTGKEPGRGAYLCTSQNCLNTAKKKKLLEKQLRCKMNEDLFNLIERELLGINKQS